MCRWKRPRPQRRSRKRMAAWVKLHWLARRGSVLAALVRGADSYSTKSGETFDGDGCGFSAADAERGDAAAEVAFGEGRKQRDEDARAGCANGMAERAGAAVDVDLLVGKAEIAHGRHRDNGESLVDLEQVDFRKRPANAVKQSANSADGRRGK